MSAQAAAATAASNAVKAAATPAAKPQAASYFNRWIVAPVVGTLGKIEKRSAAKVGGVEQSTTAWIKEHEATGADAASAATKQYLHMQGQLMHYRVVRCFEEGRYVFSGQYFKNYDIAKALSDARFATQLLFVFIVAVMVGRRGVFSPIHPDSPLAIALDHKVNPNY